MDACILYDLYVCKILSGVLLEMFLLMYSFNILTLRVESPQQLYFANLEKMKAFLLVSNREEDWISEIATLRVYIFAKFATFPTFPTSTDYRTVLKYVLTSCFQSYKPGHAKQFSNIG